MKKLIGWIIVIGIAFFVFTNLGSEDSKSDSNGASSTTKKISLSLPKAKPKPAVNTAKTTDVQTGTWTVGKDIEPGTYTITTAAGSGNVTTDDAAVNIILGATVDDDLGQVTSDRAILKKGQELEVSSLASIHLEAAKFGPAVNSGNLSAGDYVVGQDIQSGRYLIKAVEGSGNLQSSDASVNEILGTTPDDDLGQVTQVTVNLTDGQVLSSDLQAISLTKQ